MNLVSCPKICHPDVSLSTSSRCHYIFCLHILPISAAILDISSSSKKPLQDTILQCRTLRAAGHSAAGQSAAGQSTAGQSTAGHSTAAGHSAVGHSAAGQGHSAAGHSAAGHSAAGHSAAGHSAAGHSAAGHSAAGHSAGHCRHCRTLHCRTLHCRTSSNSKAEGMWLSLILVGKILSFHLRFSPQSTAAVSINFQLITFPAVFSKFHSFLSQSSHTQEIPSLTLLARSYNAGNSSNPRLRCPVS